MEAVQKQFLTLSEFAEKVGKTYGVVREWVVAGRVDSEQRKAGQKTFYRVPSEEAEKVRRQLESGLWS